MDIREHVTPTATGSAFYFGSFRLEAGVGLTQAGVSVPLAPKELSVLAALVVRRGQLASKTAILDEVWSDEVVGEESLTRCIYVLRQRLRAELGDPIATVHRRGYRFAVPVRQVAISAGRHTVLERSVRTTARAHLAYLEGRKFARLGTPSALAEAIIYYQEAQQLDPNYVVPLVAIADCYIHQCVRGLVDGNDIGPAIRDVCEQALRVDPLLASAHASLGWVHGALERRHADALTALDKAMELDHEYASGLLLRAWVLRGMGAHDAAIADLERATQLDPYLYLPTVTLAWTLFLGGRHAQALDLARHAAALNPTSSTAHAYVACIAAYLNEHREALSAARQAGALVTDPTIQVTVAYALAAGGHKDEARTILCNIEEHAHGVVRSLVCPAYVALGDFERADHWLSLAKAHRCPWLMDSLHDPRLGCFRLAVRRALNGSIRSTTDF